MKKIYVAFALLAFSLPSAGALVTIDPDDYPLGTNLTQAISSVNLYTFGYGGEAPPTYSNVYSVQGYACDLSHCTNDYYDSEIERVFGHNTTGNGYNWWGQTLSLLGPWFVSEGNPYGSGSLLYAEFLNPTDHVVVQGVARIDQIVPLLIDKDGFLIEGWGVGNGTVTASCAHTPYYPEVPGDGTSLTTCGYFSSTNSIAGIYMGSGTGSSTVASLSFNAIPIPTTAWLFGSALAGLLVTNRKRS